MSATAFYLNSPANTIKFVTLELYHPDFSKTYRFVQNAIEGLTTTLETNATVTFDYCPLRISENETLNDLDYGLEIEIGDVGELLPAEFDRVLNANGFTTKPRLTYREYRSDNLNAPMTGPANLEVKTFELDRFGVKFEATAPSLNLSRTGEFYTIARFPMLRSFL